jgi:hypothetical protein
MKSTGTSSSDIEEEFCHTDKNFYTLRTDQDKLKYCTKLSGNQETEYPDTYIQVVRFLDNIEEDSEKVPGSKFHDRAIFRVSFYQEIKYEFVNTRDRYLRTVYTSQIFPIQRFNIQAPTIIGDFPINRFIQDRNNGGYQRYLSP